ncbi:MAG: hypothetical protein Q8O89_07375 [Nanoarchaeota archaeon]|nr:hypothetical protein [Nanoarchaeota archaeon]
MENKTSEQTLEGKVNVTIPTNILIAREITRAGFEVSDESGHLLWNENVRTAKTIGMRTKEGGLFNRFFRETYQMCSIYLGDSPRNVDANDENRMTIDVYGKSYLKTITDFATKLSALHGLKFNINLDRDEKKKPSSGFDDAYG